MHSPEQEARRGTGVHPLSLGPGHSEGAGSSGAAPQLSAPAPVAGRGASPAAAGARRWGPGPEPGL